MNRAYACSVYLLNHIPVVCRQPLHHFDPNDCYILIPISHTGKSPHGHWRNVYHPVTLQLPPYVYIQLYDIIYGCAIQYSKCHLTKAVLKEAHIWTTLSSNVAFRGTVTKGIGYWVAVCWSTAFITVSDIVGEARSCGWIVHMEITELLLLIGLLPFLHIQYHCIMYVYNKPSQITPATCWHSIGSYLVNLQLPSVISSPLQ